MSTRRRFACLLSLLVLVAGCGGGASGQGDPDASAGGSSGGDPSGGTLTTGPFANDGSPLGTNLDGIADFSTQIPFVDLMKTSREWISGSGSTWDDGRSVATDANGWVRSVLPGQIVRTLMLGADQQPRSSSGRYYVLYEGKGTLQYAQGAQKVDAASVAGRDAVDYDASRGALELDITAVDAGNPLRNIRVVPDGGVCSGSVFTACQSSAQCGGGTCQKYVDQPDRVRFRPEFLEQAKHYRQIRFMDWMRTNDSTLGRWSDRARVEHARWSTDRGVPLEVMVELANTLHADPWFTLPHRADDDFARNFATFLRNQLRPDLRAWIEYSNEVWNGLFAQSDWVRAQGVLANLSGDEWQARTRMTVKRSLELFAIFRDVLGSDRLKRVLASQAANASLTEEMLSYQNAAAQADAIAVAPYFGGELGDAANVPTIRNLSADQLLDRVERSSLPMAVQWIRDQAAIAGRYGIELVAYEGGQHLVGYGGMENDEQLNRLFDGANSHPRMKSIYLAYLDAWKQAGGRAFAHYVHCGTWTKWGRWGALQYQGQPRAQSPKYDALLTFVENNRQ